MIGTVEERFWAKVRKTDGCWLWTASTFWDGYGLIGANKKLLRAHRLSWHIHNGPIPEGMEVLHKCDVRSCVKPDHLFLGTQLDNSNDMIAKGRAIHEGHRGESHPLCRITEEQAKEIKRRYLTKESKRGALAREFGIGAQHVWQIATGKCWRHLCE